MLKNLNKTRIVYFITSLSLGGAEKFLSNYLIECTNPKDVIIITLKKGGVINKILRNKNFKVFDLEFNKNFFKSFKKTFKIVKKFNPQIISAFMYHSFIVAFFYSFFLKNKKLFFFVRSSVNKISDYKFKTQIIILICAFISRFSCKIIYNSKISIKQHESLGFKKKKSFYIPNGYSIKNFPIKIKKKFNIQIRKKYRIKKETKIIGHIGRYHEMKGTEILVKSFNELVEKKNVILMIIGRNHQISKYLNLCSFENKKKILVVGELLNPLKHICSFDFHVSSSLKIEGFSNVIAENMLMEVPCIATKVGESNKIISKYGRLVEPNNYIKLKEEIKLFLTYKKLKLSSFGKNSRKHIIKNYDIKKFDKKLLKLYEQN